MLLFKYHWKIHIIVLDWSKEVPIRIKVSPGILLNLNMYQLYLVTAFPLLSFYLIFPQCFIQSDPNLTILTFIYPSNIQCFLLCKVLDVKLFQGLFAQKTKVIPFDIINIWILCCTMLFSKIKFWYISQLTTLFTSAPRKGHLTVRNGNNVISTKDFLGQNI